MDDTPTYSLKTVSPAAYERLRERWRWNIPESINIAEWICDRWARSSLDRTALYWNHEDEALADESFTFSEVSRRTNQVGNALRNGEVDRGDVVGIYLPSVPEHVFTTLGAHKIGAVAMPLSSLFGPDALRPRLDAAAPQQLITDVDGLETLAATDIRLPEPVVVLTRYDDRSPSAVDLETVSFEAWLADAAEALTPVETAPEDPAQLFFTSGTTGDPKGVLQPHRVVVGHQYVGVFAREYHTEDLVFHVGDLSWAGGFNNVLETWSIGAPLAKYSGQFSAKRVLDMLAAYDADILMIPPTAIRSLMEVDAAAIRDRDIDLRVVAAGGERVTPDILAWAEDTFDAFATNIWGQTECYGLGWPALGADHRDKLGTAGIPLPGFDAAVLDDDGQELPPEELGELAIRRTDNPTMFTEYYGMPAETAPVRTDGWHRTGDAAVVDEDGYFWVRGRLDDVIISSGYRLSPVEIESTLTAHTSVIEAAVVGVPDDQTTNRIVAYVEAGADADDALRDELRTHVREQLSPAQYPDEIHFVADIPTTATGKLRRKELREQYPGREP